MICAAGSTHQSFMTNDRAKIILVDDDPLIVESLSFVLGDEFTVISAASRANTKALLQAEDDPPVIALVDLGLPPTPHNPEEGLN